MSGPEHYREAERLLDLATRDHTDPNSLMQQQERAPGWLAAAQVHATLANVAVQEGAYRLGDAQFWGEVTQP